MAEVRAVRPGLWVVETQVEDFDVRAVLVAGAERAVVFDTLARPADMAGVAEMVPDLPLSVVYSHGDWDHVWGTKGLSRPPTAVLAHEVCRPRFAKEIPATLVEKQAEAPDEYAGIELVAPTRMFSSEMELDLGEISLKLHHLPGHTPDSVVGYIPEWGVFLAGDAVETPLPFLNDAGAVPSWVTGLQGWHKRLTEGLPTPNPVPPLVIPSHGPLGGAELLARNVEYLRALMDGEQPLLPTRMPTFYTQTHAANLALMTNL